MNETIILMGGDGYLGWPLALKLAICRPNTKVIIVDNEWRRNTVRTMGSNSLTPVARPSERLAAFKEIYDQDNLHYMLMDINSDALDELIREERPRTIYHMAQQCSVPYSMLGLSESIYTIENNEQGNMRLLWAVRKHVPEAHIIKTGMSKSYPGQSDDVCHISKINDSNYLAMACRKWNLRITEVMQSTLFGLYTPEMAQCEKLFTRFDYDDIFGTVVNRFLTQASVGHPLTVYGTGTQCSGITPLKDAVNTLEEIADNIPDAGVHKLINCGAKHKCSVNEIAQHIKDLAREKGIDVIINQAHDPRNERDSNKEEVSAQTAYSDNNISVTPISEVLQETFSFISRYKDRVCTAAITRHLRTNISGMAKGFVNEHSFLTNEQYWKEFRNYYFRSGSINLNTGSMGTVSMPVKGVRDSAISRSFSGNASGLQEYGQKTLSAIKEIAAELWPSDGYELIAENSTAQTMNLLALSMLRSFNRDGKEPYKVITTMHEHPDAIRVFEHLPEYEVHYIDDSALQDEAKFTELISRIQPHVALFSHVYYASGNFSPLINCCNGLRNVVPECKIIVDATQSIGLYELPFGVADVITGDADKWLSGPCGSGLTWLKQEFCHWINGIYRNGNVIASKEDCFTLKGGQDVMVHAELLEALKLYSHVGKDIVLHRSAFLSGIFRRKVEMVLSDYDIRYSVLTSSAKSPILAIALIDYNPCQLYKSLNERDIHCKCITGQRAGEKTYNILRFGIPYYETIDRINEVIGELQRSLSISQNAYLLPRANSAAA